MIEAKAPFSKSLEAAPHSPVYLMHRYFARRPHNVFRELISYYTKEGDLILDPFCGGGVTIVEALRLKRQAIGVDINPLATYITDMQIRPLDTVAFHQMAKSVYHYAQREMGWLYETDCPQCNESRLLKDDTAFMEWCEWEDGKMRRIKYCCPAGHSGEKPASPYDQAKTHQIETEFESLVRRYKLWYPEVPIPPGDKTNSIISKGYRHFHELFTKRNLLALSFLHKCIQEAGEESVQEFLRFALSSSLKWASEQSHLRGDIVEGWAMHAYWIYPRWLEINVLKTFEKRCQATKRGKSFMQSITEFYRPTPMFEGFDQGATVMLWTGSADHLHLPNESIDCIITDPPYGGNVNYGELADYWLVWLGREVMDKAKEAIINATQGKTLQDYEEMLHRGFKECHRVLKDSAPLVATFNCKDLQIITAFLRSVVRAGFELSDGGLLYQPPIRLYTTTVHAKEVGAFTGDFIFTFQKVSRGLDKRDPLSEGQVDDIVWQALKDSSVEIEARQRIYQTLIPLIARSTAILDGTIYALIKRVEGQIASYKFPALHFSKARSIAR